MTHARPCPWCGAEQEHADIWTDGRTGLVAVVCGNCMRMGPWGEHDGHALAKWNTRPIEDALIAALDDMVASFGYTDWDSVHDAARCDNARKVLADVKGGPR